MKTLLSVLLALFAVTAHAAGFKISEQRDDFTRTSAVHGENLKLCQVRSAGFAAECASLHLVWRHEYPDVIGVRLESPGVSSITEIAVNIGGSIERFGADVLVTDFDYSHALANLSGSMAWSSANSFVLPVEVLKAIAAQKDNGIIRVLGTHSATDYDFFRRARARGVPADELRQFLDRITTLQSKDSSGRS